MNLPKTILSIDVRLDWLIEQSGIEHGPAKRRVFAVQNQLSRLAARWRPLYRPINPAKELRMSRSTRDRLFAWVATGAHETPAIPELAPFADQRMLDETLAEGWLRMIIPSTETPV